MDIKTVEEHKIVDILSDDLMDHDSDDDQSKQLRKRKKKTKKIKEKKKEKEYDSDDDDNLSEDSLEMDNLSIDSNLEGDEPLETGGDSNPCFIKDCNTTMEYAIFAQKCIVICQQMKDRYNKLSKAINILSVIFPVLLVVASIVGLILKHKSSSFPIFIILMKCSVGFSLGLLFLIFCDKIIDFNRLGTYYGSVISDLNTFSQTAYMITFQPYSKHPFIDSAGCSQEFARILHDSAEILQKILRWKKRHDKKRKRRYKNTDD